MILFLMGMCSSNNQSCKEQQRSQILYITNTALK